MINRLDLANCPIFSALSPERREELIGDIDYTVATYSKGEQVARQGDLVKALSILVKGSVKSEMITENGGILTIEVIKAPRPLAPAFLFASENYFPVDVTALEECTVVSIPKDEVLRLFQKDTNFLEHYIIYNSNVTQFLSQKLQILTIKTIRGKLAHYLLEQLSIARLSNPNNKSFTMDKNQTELAKYFGVSRPALARTLSSIQQEGAIKTERNRVEILDKTLLQKMQE